MTRTRSRRCHRRNVGQAVEVETLEQRLLLSAGAIAQADLSTPAPHGPIGDAAAGSPEFLWSDVAGADRYDLLVRSLSTGNTVLRERRLTGTAYTPETPLLPDDYRWNVRAIDADGNRSGWSPVQSFTVTTGESNEFDGLLGLRPQPWIRRDDPILSALSTDQEWAKSKLYMPSVLYRDGKFRMWYVGERPWDATRTPHELRANDRAIGYAESDDGIHWSPFDANPVLLPEDIPWAPPLGTPDTGPALQTPFVIYDEDENLYKMWFVSVTDLIRDENGKKIEMTQKLGYATSLDGINWDVWPEPIYGSGRSPSIIKEGPNQYRMWMNSRPSLDVSNKELYRNIYEFTSTDGIHWTRGAEPSIQPSGLVSSTIYPQVVKEGGRYYMWYGGHVAGGRFEIFAAESEDGTHWQIDHDTPAFSASRDPERFDGRYASTPFVVALDDRFLLYYSARDLDKSAYRHIGVATLPRTPSTPSLTVSMEDTGRPTLAWTLDPAAQHYDLIVKNMDTGQRVIRERYLLDNSLTPDAPLPTGRYKAVVRSLNFVGDRSEWSDSVVFAIDGADSLSGAEVGSAMLLAPNGTITDTTPTFRWQRINGTDHYDLQVKHLDTAERVIRERRLPSTEFVPEFELAAGHYRAWVRALSAEGQRSDWSDGLTFTITEAGAIVADSLDEEADNVMLMWPQTDWWIV